MQAVRARDLTVHAAGRVDVNPLTGSWVNTETRSRWLAALDVRADGERLRVRGWGGDPRSPADWGEGEVEMVCATAIDATEAGGMVARFATSRFETELHATLNQGLLVVVAFNRTSGAAAPGMMAREFFRRAEERS